MGGCLGPRQRRQQVYMQVIQTIHQQVTQMTFSYSSQQIHHKNKLLSVMNKSQEQLDMYMAIKQKLTKKGLLRKLIDNLISHRNKIYDSLNHNYQIVLQSSRVQNKYAGLLIMDQIIEGIYQSINKEHLQQNSKNNPTVDNDSLLHQPSNYSNTNALNSNLVTKPQNNNKSLLLYYNSLIKEKKSPLNLMQTPTMMRQIDGRFDQNYFNLIKYLLETVPKMYLRCLKSLDKFCLFKSKQYVNNNQKENNQSNNLDGNLSNNGGSKFICTESVWIVLNFLMENIRNHKYLKQNTKTYMLLLQNTKQNFKDYQKQADLMFFIKLWMVEQEKQHQNQVDSQRNPDNTSLTQNQQHQNLQKHRNLQKHQKTQQQTPGINLRIKERIHTSPLQQSLQYHQQSFQQYSFSSSSPNHSNQSLILNLIKIISSYFNTNISTWNSGFLFNCLLSLYDEYEYQLGKLNGIECLVYSIVSKNDLYVQFFRGLFLQLLEVMGDVTRQSDNNGFGVSGKIDLVKDRKVSENFMWGARGNSGIVLEEKPQSNLATKTQVRLQALKTIRRWANKKYADLNETVSYNCSLLVSAYISNLEPQSAHNNQCTLQQLLKLIRQHLSAKSKQILISTLIQQIIKSSQTDQSIRSIILNLIQQLLSNNDDKEIFYNFGEDFDYIIIIDMDCYGEKNSIELVQLMGFLVTKLPQSYFSQVADYTLSGIINFRHRMGEFLESCLEVVVSTTGTEEPIREDEKLKADRLLFKYRFCCALLSFFKAIQARQNYSFIFAFYLQLLNQLALQQKLHLPHQTPTIYYLIYIIHELQHLLNPSIPVPTNLSLINSKISNNNNHQSLSIKTSSSLSTKYSKQIQIMIENFITQEKYKKSLKQLENQTFNLNELDKILIEQNGAIIVRKSFQAIRKIFRNYFIGSGRRNGRGNEKHDISQEHSRVNRGVQEEDFRNSHTAGSFGYQTGGINLAAKNAFSRRDSIYQDSQNMSYQQQDRNFKDVLNILNQ